MITFACMFSKASLILFIIVTCYVNTYGQGDDFCNAITTIVRDAPNKFRNIKGKITESNANATMWACGITVPGTIGSRFVSSMGLFYEGVFFQTRNKDGLKASYDKYLAVMSNCLVPAGYKLSMQDNFSTGMESYKKAVFLPLSDGETKPGIPKGHFAMETIYSKEMNQYTIVMYIFEH